MNGKKLTALTFYLVLAIAATGMAVSPKGDFSQAEQRSLASLPTLSSVWDGSSGEKLEDYLADHFPLRTEWMSLRTRLQQLTGRKVVQDVYLLYDRLMERTDPISEESVKQSTAAVMEIAGRFSGATSLMLIPSASEIHSDLLPDGISNVSQKIAIDRAYEQVSKSVNTLDCYSTLSANRERYLYYRSDSHWTSLGAYLAYSASATQLGFTATSLDRMNIEHASHHFLGNLYRRVMVQDFLPDSIDLYTLPGERQNHTVQIFDGRSWETHDGVYFREYLQSENASEVFLGPREPAIDITTMPGDRTLLIIDDEWAHTLIPFLIPHYSRITLIDPEAGPLPAEISADNYSQLLFCYPVENFGQVDFTTLDGLF